MILESNTSVHLEAISSDEEINKLITLLEKTYNFAYFSSIPIKDNK